MARRAPPPELYPPQANSNLLRSYSSATVVDLLCEGPIYGLVDSDGRALESFEYGRGVFFNDVPVQDDNRLYNFQQSKIELYHGLERLNTDGLEDFNIPSISLSSNTYKDLPVNKIIYGPFDRNQGAALGLGSIDVRGARNFSSWAQDYQHTGEAKGHFHTVTEDHINEAFVNFKITKLFDTNDAGAYVVGTNKPTNISFSITRGYENDDESNFLVNEYSITGIVQSAYEFKQSVSLPEADGRDRFIKIDRITPESLSPLIGREIAVSSIVESCSTKFSFPFTAIALTKFDARYFSEIPQRSFQCKLKLVKIPSNYFPTDERKTIGESLRNPNKGTDKRKLTKAQVAASVKGERIYEGDWDGTFKIGWTDNPAWIIYDLISNNVYGLGNQIDESALSKWSLYEIGRYCDAADDDGYFVGVDDGSGNREPRFCMNVLITEQKEAFELISYVCSVFRGICYWYGGGIEFASDRPRDPVMAFCNADVQEGVFNYSEAGKNTRYTAVEVSYNDKTDNYIPKIEYVEEPDSMAKYGLIKNESQGLGFTSRSQARRFAKYLLLSSRYEPEVVNFTAGQQALYLKPGDVITINDELRSFCKNYGKIFAKDLIEDKLILDTVIPTENLNGGEDDIYSGVVTLIVPEENTDAAFLDRLLNPEDDAEPVIPSLEDIRNFRRPQIMDFPFYGSGKEIFLTSGQDKIALVPDHSSYIITVNGFSPKKYRVLTIKEGKEGFNEVLASTFFEEKFSGADFDIAIDPSSDYLESVVSTLLPPEPPVLDEDSCIIGANGGMLSVSFPSVTDGVSDISYRIIVTSPNGRIDTYVKNSASDPEDFELAEYLGIGNYQVKVYTVAMLDGISKVSMSYGQSNFEISYADAPILNFASISARNVSNQFFVSEELKGTGYWDESPIVVDFSLTGSPDLAPFDTTVKNSPYIKNNEVSVRVTNLTSLNYVDFITESNSFVLDSSKIAEVGSTREYQIDFDGLNTDDEAFAASFFLLNPEPSIEIDHYVNQSGINEDTELTTGLLSFFLVGDAYSKYKEIDIFTGATEAFEGMSLFETFVPVFDESFIAEKVISSDLLNVGDRRFFRFRAKDSFGNGPASSASPSLIYVKEYADNDVADYFFRLKLPVSSSFASPTGEYVIKFDKPMLNGYPHFSFEASGNSEQSMNGYDVYIRSLNTGEMILAVDLNVLDGAGLQGGTLFITVDGETYA